MSTGYDATPERGKMAALALHLLGSTSEWDNPLLWAHYAVRHFGICIGFRTELDVFQLAEDVSYTSELPVILRPQDDRGAMLEKAFSPNRIAGHTRTSGASSNASLRARPTERVQLTRAVAAYMTAEGASFRLIVRVLAEPSQRRGES